MYSLQGGNVRPHHGPPLRIQLIQLDQTLGQGKVIEVQAPEVVGIRIDFRRDVYLERS